MKKLNLFPLLAAMALLCTAATIDVYQQPEVTTPDSGNDIIPIIKTGGGVNSTRKIKLGNIIPKPSDAGLSNDVWIAIRTDGLAGDGTQRNPFDGSTQTKLDAILAAISASNVHVHLGPGTFTTRGLLTWTIRNGWDFSGAGMMATTLQQSVCSDATSTGHQDVVIAGNGTAYDASVHDLTVDCNYTALKGGQISSSKGIQAINISSGHVYNVRAIHCGGTGETFAINAFVSGASATVPESVVIEKCKVELCDDNVTAFMASASHTNDNSDNATFGTQAIISHCYADGASVGYQINGYKTGLVDGCTALSTIYPYTHDTLPDTNLTISNCYFQKSTATGQVITFAGGSTCDGVAGHSCAVVDQVSIANNILDQNSNDISEINLANATSISIDRNRFVGGSGGSFNPPIVNSNSSTTTTNNRVKTGRANGSGTLLAGQSVGNRYMDNTNITWLKDSFTYDVVRSNPVTFANLPATPIEGMMASVTDSSTSTRNATITGSGSNHVLAYYDGTNWVCK